MAFDKLIKGKQYVLEVSDSTNESMIEPKKQYEQRITAGLPLLGVYDYHAVFEGTFEACRAEQEIIAAKSQSAIQLLENCRENITYCILTSQLEPVIRIKTLDEAVADNIRHITSKKRHKGMYPWLIVYVSDDMDDINAKVKMMS